VDSSMQSNKGARRPAQFTKPHSEMAAARAFLAKLSSI
jgi:hypothetical protein